MEDIIIENIHSVCRTCLQEFGEKSSPLGEKYSLHDSEDLEKLLMACTAMAYEDEVELPEFICYSCYEKLQSFYDFCCKSAESLFILTHILKESNRDPLVQASYRGREIKPENRDTCVEMSELCEVISPTRRRRKLQSCLENTVHNFRYSQVLQIPEEPTESPKVIKKDITENFDEVEIDISDIKLNAKEFLSIASYSRNYDDSLEYLEICRESPDLQSDEGRLTDIVISEQSQDKEYNTNCEKFSDDHSDTSAKLSTNERSKSGKNIKRKASHKKKKPTKSKKFSEAKSVKQSQIGIGGGAAKFQCEQCPRRCVTSENLEAHLRTHQGLKPFLCKDCGRSFNNGNHFRRHVRDVHGPRPVELTFICPVEGCGKFFNREASCKMHYRLKHNPAIANRKPKSLVCEDCGKTFPTNSKLIEHRYKHLPMEQYPHKCDECGKRYKNRRTFRDHQLRHAGIKNFICPHCGVRKTTKNELHTHINYHTKERQWPCSKCASVFNNSGNLRLHDRIVHLRLRPYMCSYCDKSFGKQATWKHHEMRHTGEKPYGCDMCGKRFIQSVALRAHMRSHNGENSTKSIKQPIKETPVAFLEGIVDSEI
ncbi:zinc finger protein 2 homolog isoform X1 [Rhagoletis pomonella]|uniref:zinc finger protein 2 homolog isoform X1 n=1 Tax=Rhagoletis pomonella TaxID=28610 RepID=UPI00177E5E30|nr:zinc finger protein 2 homolog isoform X1 [Rhagoletis pomonella]